jgi:septal ring factor EnvC (AmiA/AmiB activator)
VLYLKHNLNAQAVSSLRKEVADIETEVSSLIADMNRSIKEADAFVKNLAGIQSRSAPLRTSNA